MSAKDFNVTRLAELARISLTDEETSQFTQQLEHILGYVDQLQAIDTVGVEETAQVTGLENVLRTDEPSVNTMDDLRLRRTELLAASPAVDQSMVKVPVILAEQ